MEEKNKQNKQELDKKDELRRLVLAYIGEKDIKKAGDVKLSIKKEPKFSKLEQIQTAPVKDDKENGGENKINKEDIDNARKAILDHLEGKKFLPVKKTVLKSIGAGDKKIEFKSNGIKNKNKGKEIEKKEIQTAIQIKGEKVINTLNVKDKRGEFKKKDFSIINIIIAITILVFLLIAVLASHI